MTAQKPQRGYWPALLSCRCPRCREGLLFQHPLTFLLRRNMKMHARCPVCTQVTDIEVGFYYGTGYVSYLIGIFLTIISFFLWFLIIGFSFQDRRFAWWIILNSVGLILLQPWLMRFSRVLWLSWFVKYDPDWPSHKPDDPERIIDSEMNNW